jgi:Fe-S-cluster containining protein
MLPIIEDVIECSCDDCVAACKRKPGWFTPEEIKPAAEFLGMTEKEFFDKYLSVDYYGKPDSFLFVLSPATKNSSPGEEFPLNPNGECVFLTEDKKCKIHAVKPCECKAFDHRKKDLNGRDLHLEVAESWLDRKAYITELMGREPVVKTPNLLEALEMLLAVCN